jgi:hypothetical protein
MQPCRAVLVDSAFGAAIAGGEAIGAFRIESAAAGLVALALDANPPSFVAGMRGCRTRSFSHASLGTPPNRRIADEASLAILISPALHAAMKRRVTSGQAGRVAIRVGGALEAKAALQVAVERGQGTVGISSAPPSAAARSCACLSARRAWPPGA